MNKIIDALKLAENTLEDIIRVYKFETGTPVTALAAIREVLAEQAKCACDSPAWCTKYKKCNREMLGLPKAEPVKQEPVAWVDAKEEGYEFYGISYLPVGKHHLYAAPVSAEAIRAEALEEAIKIVDNVLGRQNAVSAAIRGLK